MPTGKPGLGAFSPLWQRPANAPPALEPRAITESHRRRLGGGQFQATAPRLDWATLLQRTYQVDVFVCPRCQGPARIVAAITEPDVIRKILRHVREPPTRTPPSGAALIHELRPMVVQLVVHDPLGVIDAPVQSHVETEGEEAHGVGFYEERAQRRAARAIDAMPNPGG